jgi:predicted dehydrogenase
MWQNNSMKDAMTQVAVVGVGGWGKNLVRNYDQIQTANLKYICDIDEVALAQVHKLYPNARATTQLELLLEDEQLEAVIVATPAVTHYKLCRAALEAGKDVYVEKPFVLRVEEAEELIELADRLERVLMVGHLLKYHPVVTLLADMVQGNELGTIHYIYSQRLNLGTVRSDESSLWNFAPHDISVILHLLGKDPVDVSARGQCYLQPHVEDVVFLNLNFGDRRMAHVHVSWLDPHKVRKMTIVGSKKMAVFDDLETTEKLRIYDKGANFNGDYDTFAEYIGLRFGDITMPYISMSEPLQLECNHFLDCVRQRTQPLTDGRDGLRVVKVLTAAQESLARNGVPVSLQ